MDMVVTKINEFTGLEDGMIKDSIMSKIGWELAYFGLLTLVYALLMGVFMYFMRQSIIVMSRLIENDLRSEIFAHYEK